MKKIIKPLAYIMLIVLIVIQFIKPNLNAGPVVASTHLREVFVVPKNVESILQKSCYDCHSNNTNYPWYSNIQPVAWWLNSHVKDGKKHLNFDEYTAYNLRRRYHKLEEVVEQLEIKEMPLSSYTLIHQDAKLSDADAEVLMNWAKASMDSMKSKYPIDSLVKKK